MRVSIRRQFHFLRVYAVLNTLGLAVLAGAVHDVTSWNAYLLGDPVRLVQ